MALENVDDLYSIASRTSSEVFHAHVWGVSWGARVIEQLKAIASENARSRARLCLHPTTTDLHQEMLIVMSRNAVETPQRRPRGFDTKLVLEGRATMWYYSPSGARLRNIKLGHSGLTYVHTRSDDYHALSITSDWFVFLEIAQGPFDSQTTEFAPWAIGGRRLEH